jgi:hypothetical protein
VVPIDVDDVEAAIGEEGRSFGGRHAQNIGTTAVPDQLDRDGGVQAIERCLRRGAE